MEGVDEDSHQQVLPLELGDLICLRAIRLMSLTFFSSCFRDREDASSHHTPFWANVSGEGAGGEVAWGNVRCILTHPCVLIKAMYVQIPYI